MIEACACEPHAPRAKRRPQTRPNIVDNTSVARTFGASRPASCIGRVREVVVRTDEITRGKRTVLTLGLAVVLGITVHGQAPVNRGSQGVYPSATQGQVTWVGCLVRVEQNP